jgi:hypothetical protein
MSKALEAGLNQITDSGIVLFGPLRQATASAWAASPTVLATTGSASATLHGFVYLLLVVIILFSAMAGLASGGLNTAIQRDWYGRISYNYVCSQSDERGHRVMTIAADDSAKLTVLNTWLRRVDLVCKLLAPVRCRLPLPLNHAFTSQLFISLLTTAASYRFSVFFLLAFTVVSGAYELVLVKYVYSSFPVLAEDEAARRAAAPAAPANPGKKASFGGMVSATRDSLSQMGKDLAEFARLPIFLSPFPRPFFSSACLPPCSVVEHLVRLPDHALLRSAFRPHTPAYRSDSVDYRRRHDARVPQVPARLLRPVRRGHARGRRCRRPRGHTRDARARAPRWPRPRRCVERLVRDATKRDAVD